MRLFIFKDAINFMKYKWICLIVSTVLVFVSLGSLFIKGLNLGLDFTGGTVIVDHGMDIFTVYGHLSKVKAKEGQMVELGEIIGLSGNTGRSSGPHLHWGVKIHGHYINGFSLIEETKKQFP